MAARNIITIERYLDRVRSYHHTEPYQKAMGKRQIWGEPVVGEAKAWPGLERFRLRGRRTVNMAAVLSAAGPNLKRLLSRWGYGNTSHLCPVG